MKQIIFKNIEEFVNEIDDKFNKFLDLSNEYEYPAIVIIAKYEETRQIIKELLWTDYNLRSIESLDAPDFGDYNDEYIISITNIDEDYEIWCEPMKKENDYISVDGNIIYILDNCSSKVIPYLCSKCVFEINITGENEETKNDENNEKLNNFNKSSKYTVTSYNGESVYNKNLDTEKTQKIINDVKCKIQHMYDMVDEMNNFRELFNW